MKVQANNPESKRFGLGSNLSFLLLGLHMTFQCVKGFLHIAIYQRFT